MAQSKRSARHGILVEILRHLKTAYEYVPPTDSVRTLLNSPGKMDPLLSYRSDSHLDDLRAAILRLDTGTYGLCIACKKRIPQVSLDADVTRRMCPSCEADFNKHIIIGETVSSARWK